MSFSRSKVTRFSDLPMPRSTKQGSSSNLTPLKGIQKKDRFLGYNSSSYSPCPSQSKTRSPRSNSASLPSEPTAQIPLASCLRSRSCGDEKKMIGLEVQAMQVEEKFDVDAMSREIVETMLPVTVTVMEPGGLESETMTKVTDGDSELSATEGLTTVEEDMGILTGQEIDSRLRDDESTIDDNKEIMYTLLSINDEREVTTEVRKKRSTTSSHKSASGIPVKCTAPSPKTGRAPPVIVPKMYKTSTTGSNYSMKTNQSSPKKTSQTKMPTTPGVQNKLKVATRNLECQFIAKKKRFQLLKKEVMDKQQPVIELYNQLLELKRQVRDRSGKELPLDDINLVECKDQQIRINIGSTSQPSSKPTTPEKAQPLPETTIGDADLDKCLTSAYQIPTLSLELYKNILDKRTEILMTLRNYHDLQAEDLTKHLEKFTLETSELETKVETETEKQKEMITTVVQQLRTVCVHVGGDAVQNAETGDHVESLEKRVEELQSMLAVASKQAKDSSDAHSQQMHSKAKEISGLNKKIKDLESELEAQHSANHEVKERACSNDSSMKQMKVKLRDAESKYKEADRKYQETQKSLKKLQETYKTAEDNWIIKHRDLDKQLKIKEHMIHKLTTDRGAFETRIKTLEEMLKDTDKAHLDDKAELASKVTELENRVEVFLNEKSLLESKCMAMQWEIAKVESQRERALKLARKDNASECSFTYESGFETKREKELYLDLEATKISLSECSRKASAYKEEKMRFLEVISKMTVREHEKNRDELVKSLVEKEKGITKLQQEVAEYREALEMLQIRAEQLAIQNGDLENRLGVVTNEDARCNNDDKVQLDEALAKITTHKQRIASLEGELQKRNQKLKEMENLLKMRDDFINILKEKKDRAVSDNETLNEYSNKLLEQFKIVSNQLIEKNDKLVCAAVKLDKMQQSLSEAEDRILEQKSNMHQLNDRRFKLQSETEKLQEELQTLRKQVGHNEGFYQRYENKSRTPSKHLQPQSNSVPVVHPSQAQITAEIANRQLDKLRQNIINYTLRKSKQLESKLESLYTVIAPNKTDISKLDLTECAINTLEVVPSNTAGLIVQDFANASIQRSDPKPCDDKVNIWAASADSASIASDLKDEFLKHVNTIIENDILRNPELYNRFRPLCDDNEVSVKQFCYKYNDPKQIHTPSRCYCRQFKYKELRISSHSLQSRLPQAKRKRQ